ncbi:TIR domain-containing protein [Plantactinospora sp. WMMB782]|uniref:TIR domain-containing protein n=1 Tax=Plantactinospora sp. WMMB782 TaxID=3404121 RepID=UPI003B9321AE
MTGTESYEFDFSLSYASEQREYVDEVAKTLASSGVTVFYDQDRKAEIWGKNLYDYLDEVYRTKAKYCIVFASREYASKIWTNHERESAQARAVAQAGDYILPVRFDDTTIPGLRPTLAYLDARVISAREVAELALSKLRLGQSHDQQTPPADGLYADSFLEQVRRLLIANGSLNFDPSAMRKLRKRRHIPESEEIIAFGRWRRLNGTSDIAFTTWGIRIWLGAKNISFRYADINEYSFTEGSETVYGYDDWTDYDWLVVSGRGQEIAFPRAHMLQREVALLSTFIAIQHLVRTRSNR